MGCVRIAVERDKKDAGMTQDCKALVEVSIQRDGRQIPLGIMNHAQALDLPHHRDFVFVHLAARADGSHDERPRRR